MAEKLEFEDFEGALFRLGDDGSDELYDLLLFHDNPRQIATWLAQILTNWEARVKNLSHDDQNAVIWRIGTEPAWLGSYLGSGSRLSFEEQVQLLSSAKFLSLAIPNLFAPAQPMENGYFMWWDILAKSIGSVELAVECLRILEELTMHPDRRVQYAALHGLGHLRLPESALAVERYLESHPEGAADNVILPWILECRNGTVM